MSKLEKGMNNPSVLSMIISRFNHIYLVHHKIDFLEKFKKYKASVENKLGNKDTSIRLRWRIYELTIPRLFDKT